MTASSANSWALKQQDGNETVGYTMKETSDGAAKTAWEFTTLPGSATLGIDVAYYSSKPAGTYQDTVTFMASVVSASVPVTAITLNKNMVPFDTRSPFQTSGFRIGTPAVTSRGFVEKDMLDIVDLIDTVLASSNAHFAALTAKEPTDDQLTERAAHTKVLDDVIRKVHMMTAGRPLNKY